MTLTPQQAHDLIAFYVETGVDVALDETPRDRLSEPAAAAKTSATASRSGPDFEAGNANRNGPAAQAPLPRAISAMPAPCVSVLRAGHERHHRERDDSE